MGRTIAIGDIHGCANALQTLLTQIDPQPLDTIVTLGDYIDRGDNSRGVIDCLLELGQRCRHVPLIGNHEVMLLAARESAANRGFWMDCGGAETLTSYGPSLDDIPTDHWEFFFNCLPYFTTDRHIFLHANYDPNTPVDRQPEHVYLWQHVDRSIPAPHASGKTVIVGHTPQFSGEILDAGHLICIDTYCVGTGWLTAFEVDSRQVWQADKRGQLREPNDSAG